MLKSFLMFRLLSKVPFVLVFEVCGRELVQKSVLRFSRHLKTISQISFIVRFAPDLSRAHHERPELPDGHDGFMNVYVLISAVAIELHGGAEVEGGDHGAGATHAVGAVHQSWAVAGKEAMYINLNQTQYLIMYNNDPLVFPTSQFSWR